MQPSLLKVRVDNKVLPARGGPKLSDSPARHGGRILSMSPPRHAKPRLSDHLRSGTLDLGDKAERICNLAVTEAVRVFGGRPGSYYMPDGSRRYTYNNPSVNFGREGGTACPRIHFSRQVDTKTIEEGYYDNTQEELRFDYDQHFADEMGSMGVDPENRPIRQMSPNMEEMANILWEAMGRDDRYKQYCRPGQRLTHCSMHPYRAGMQIQSHEDRRRNHSDGHNGRNSMVENSPVITLTVGDTRVLDFHRRYPVQAHVTNRSKMFTETDACYRIAQQHGCAFLLDPNDEKQVGRRGWDLKRHPDATFVHGLKTPRVSQDRDYFSVAFVFRVVRTTTRVNVMTDLAVPKEPTTEDEFWRLIERIGQRWVDEEAGSQFQEQVKWVRGEWKRLMLLKGWMKPQTTYA